MLFFSRVIFLQKDEYFVLLIALIAVPWPAAARGHTSVRRRLKSRFLLQDECQTHKDCKGNKFYCTQDKECVEFLEECETNEDCPSRLSCVFHIEDAAKSCGYNVGETCEEDNMCAGDLLCDEENGTCSREYYMEEGDDCSQYNLCDRSNMLECNGNSCQISSLDSDVSPEFQSPSMATIPNVSSPSPSPTPVKSPPMVPSPGILIPSPVAASPVPPSPASRDTYFSLKLDWNPTLCFESSKCNQSKVINAFTVKTMGLRPKEEASCSDAITDPSSSIVPGTRSSMDCVWQTIDAGDKNSNLWNQIYNSDGVCTGSNGASPLDPNTYFTVVTNQYARASVNIALQTLNITDGQTMLKNSVDRNLLMDTITKLVGKKTWVECNSDTKELKTVVICLSTVAPYAFVDCPMDRNDPKWENGIACEGTLKLPSVKSPKGAVPSNCQQFITFGTASASNTLPEAGVGSNDSTTDTGASNQESGSSDSLSTGALVGIIVGSVAGLLLLVALVVFIMLVVSKGQPRPNSIAKLSRPPREFVINDKSNHKEYEMFWKRTEWEPFLVPNGNGFKLDPQATKSSSLPKLAGVYEFGLVHPQRKTVPPVVVYVGKSAGKGGIGKRQNDYVSSGSHIKDFIENSVVKHGCHLYRRIHLARPDVASELGEHGAADDNVEMIETKCLSYFNYAFNKEQNGASRFLYLRPKFILWCIPFGVFIRYQGEKSGKKAFHEVDENFPEVFPSSNCCNSGCM